MSIVSKRAYKLSQVPTEYIQRQTLKNVKRYIIPKLKTFEDKVLSSRARINMSPLSLS